MMWVLYRTTNHTSKPAIVPINAHGVDYVQYPLSRLEAVGLEDTFYDEPKLIGHVEEFDFSLRDMGSHGEFGQKRAKV